MRRQSDPLTMVAYAIIVLVPATVIMAAWAIWWMR